MPSPESGKSVQMLGKRVVVNERELFSRRPWKEDFLLGDRCAVFRKLMFWVRVRPVSPRAEAALVSGEAVAECVRAGHVTMETVQSIELEQWPSQGCARAGVEGPCEAVEDEKERSLKAVEVVVLEVENVEGG